MVLRQRSVGTRNTPMALYEHVFLARQDLSQAQVDALAESATKIVEELKGKVVKTETWGLRTLTYKIQKNRKAHFVMLEIDSGGDAIAELERQTRLNEDVIRYMTVRVEAHEKGPSVMMRKQERSERSERGGFGGGDRDRGDRGGFGGGDRDRGERAPRRPREEEV
jgi:small subunit ribosomal protein S6